MGGKPYNCNFSNKHTSSYELVLDFVIVKTLSRTNLPPIQKKKANAGRFVRWKTRSPNVKLMRKMRYLSLN